MARSAQINAGGVVANTPQLGTPHSGAPVLTIREKEVMVEGEQRVCRFCPIALLARDRVSQPNPTKTVGAGWLHSCAFQKWCNNMPCTSAHHSDFGMRYQRILLPCSHCTITGDRRPHQTAKSWFRKCLT